MMFYALHANSFALFSCHFKMKGLNISEVWEEDVTSLKIETILTAYQKIKETPPEMGGNAPFFNWRCP